jgi:perosamine synthetase
MLSELNYSSYPEKITLSEPEIRGNEWNYIKECLDKGWVSSAGDFVIRFEREFAAYVGARQAAATVNGTAALHIALLVAGIQPDEEVLVSDLTFIAPANAIRYVGAWPVFIDAEPDYWQMDPQRLADFLDQECRLIRGELCNKTSGRRVTAILPVHILGHPVEIGPIAEIARKYNLLIIEDATESLGATYQDQMVGSLGDIACFSFNGNKLITTGGGGMLVTDNEAWSEKARYLTTQAKDDPLEYIHKEIGYNFRLTNIQAAMGCAQLEQITEYIGAKRRIAAAYSQAFQGIPGITPMQEASWAFSVFWMFTILVDEGEYGINSRALMGHLQDQGIQTRPLWHPLHLNPAHAGCQVYGGKVALELYRRALSLPCSVGLSPSAQEYVINSIRRLGGNA